jgi:predicted dithiol-disulfide oxidoreductase (DUF899 family)
MPTRIQTTVPDIPYRPLLRCGFAMSNVDDVPQRHHPLTLWTKNRKAARLDVARDQSGIWVHVSAAETGTRHAVVPRDEWLEARKALLVQEKEFTRLRDELSALRRELPWERVEKDYAFDGPHGEQTLAELFDGRTQLVVYHFMFGPDDDVGCKSCSFWADNFDPNVVHLKARDVTFVAISRAPYEKLAGYKQRMGWRFDWYSSGRNDFNFDYGVSFAPEDLDKELYNYGTLPPRIEDREGMSVFVKEDDGNVFHTYSSYARGIDLLNTAYNYLDLVPKGRDENGQGQSWVRRRDEYGA